MIDIEFNTRFSALNGYDVGDLEHLNTCGWDTPVSGDALMKAGVK